MYLQINLKWLSRSLITTLVWLIVKSNSLVLHYASLLRTIFASLARAHECVHIQNAIDFPQTKLSGEINSPFLLNEHGAPLNFFSGICWEQSDKKHMWRRKKSLIVANHRTVRESAIFLQPSNQKQLKWSNTAYVNKWNFAFKIKLCVFQVTKT